ncbi:hypothetical protein HDU76_008137 [Blyttiomyces sp. JEL0837]|nr:hypothetical protein HDU76_008137 [Blyttiomyces sp. JEL0837]
MVLIRLDGNHLSPIIVSVLVAISDGFCGCLTTVSTMANELIQLSVYSAIIYAGTSVLISQVAIGAVIFPFTLPPTTTPVLVPTAPILFCPSFAASCDQFLNMIGCPAAQSVNIACNGDEATFVGTCTCGSKFDVSIRIAEALFDNQLKPFIPKAMNTTFTKAGFAGGPLANGPAPVAAAKDPNALIAFNTPMRRDAGDQQKIVAVGKAELTPAPGQTPGAVVQEIVLAVLPSMANSPHMTTNMCSMYPSACSGLLDQIRCPAGLRNITGGCVDGTLAKFSDGCTCGNIDSSGRVRELLIDSQIKGDIAYLKIHQPPSTANGNWSMAMCPSYARTCDTLMTKVNCLAEMIQNVACNDATPDTFVGTCTCGQFVADKYVRENLIENDVQPQVKDFIYTSTKFTFFKTVEVCPTYTSVCQEFLDRVGCPVSMSVNNACNGGSALDSFAGQCACGLIEAGERVKQLVIDALIVPVIPSMVVPSALFINR